MDSTQREFYADGELGSPCCLPRDIVCVCVCVCVCVYTLKFPSTLLSCFQLPSHAIKQLHCFPLLRWKYIFSKHLLVGEPYSLLWLSPGVLRWESRCVAQVSLKLLGWSCPPASVSWVAGTTITCHHSSTFIFKHSCFKSFVGRRKVLRNKSSFWMFTQVASSHAGDSKCLFLEAVLGAEDDTWGSPFCILQWGLAWGL
jgi:hypothetical protein